MSKPERAGQIEVADDAVPQIAARTVSEERTVFTEEDNPDGWIATDLTVPLEE